MSHNFTQPEEIDYILMAMADNDTERDAPVQDRVQSSRTLRDAECDGLAYATGFPCGAGHKKQVQGLPDS